MIYSSIYLTPVGMTQTTNVVKMVQKEFSTRSGSDRRFVKLTDDIYIVAPDNQTFPQFDFATFVPAGTGQRNGTFIFDSRSTLRSTGEVRVRDQWRNKLELVALEASLAKDPHELASIRGSIAACFARWAGATLSRTFGLSVVDQEKLITVMGVYYYGMCSDKETLDRMSPESLEDILVRFCVSYLRQDQSWVSEILSGIDIGNLEITSFSSVLAASVEYLQSPVFKPSMGAAVQVLATQGWIGQDAAMLSGSSVFYPPVFIHLLDVANRNSLFAKSKIGQAMLTVQRQRIDISGISRFASEVYSDYGVASFAENGAPSIY